MPPMLLPGVMATTFAVPQASAESTAAAKGTREQPAGVPKTLHFIWVGNPPSGHATQNLIAWAKAARASGWRMKVWTDSNTPWPMDRGSFLAQVGVEFADVRQAIDPRVQAVWDGTREQARGFNAASDVARYSILLREGGVYLDVDLGSHGVTLPVEAPSMSVHDLPVPGPLLRDRAMVTKKLIAGGIDPLRCPPGQAIASALDVSARQGDFGNQMLVAPAGNHVIDLTLRQISKRLEEHDLPTLLRNVSELSGPDRLFRAMRQYLEDRGEQINQPQHILQHVDAGLRTSWWNSVNWITEESDAQLYSAPPATSQAKKKTTAPKRTASTRSGTVRRQTLCL
ncbi:glycosyltransferase [Streptomyces erythrochromogenes]|uniref:glycosyltransferase n=1 Tax=Streptomyces erythrochromogenes TaxID=285574 RepID=UPI0036B4C89A